MIKTFIIGLVVLTLGLYLVTYLAGGFTLAAKDVFAATGDAAVAIPQGFEGGSLDFASSPLAALLYWCTIQLKWIGAGILCTARMRHDVVEPRSHHPQPETHGTEKFYRNTINRII